jgi:hypothetical protein
MSDFLIVIPAGWTQLDWEYLSNNVHGIDVNAATSGPISDMETLLKDSGSIPIEASLLEFKLLDNTYFMVRLG